MGSAPQRGHPFLSLGGSPLKCKRGSSRWPGSLLLSGQGTSKSSGLSRPGPAQQGPRGPVQAKGGSSFRQTSCFRARCVHELRDAPATARLRRADRGAAGPSSHPCPQHPEAHRRLRTRAALSRGRRAGSCVSVSVWSCCWDGAEHSRGQEGQNSNRCCDGGSSWVHTTPSDLVARLPDSSQ